MDFYINPDFTVITKDDIPQFKCGDRLIFNVFLPSFCTQESTLIFAAKHGNFKQDKAYPYIVYCDNFKSVEHQGKIIKTGIIEFNSAELCEQFREQSNPIDLIGEFEYSDTKEKKTTKTFLLRIIPDIIHDSCDIDTAITLDYATKNFVTNYVESYLQNTKEEQQSSFKNQLQKIDELSQTLILNIENRTETSCQRISLLSEQWNQNFNDSNQHFNNLQESVSLSLKKADATLQASVTQASISETSSISAQKFAESIEDAYMQVNETSQNINKIKEEIYNSIDNFNLKEKYFNESYKTAIEQINDTQENFKAQVSETNSTLDNTLAFHKHDLIKTGLETQQNIINTVNDQETILQTLTHSLQEDLSQSAILHQDNLLLNFKTQADQTNQELINLKNSSLLELAQCTQELSKIKESSESFSQSAKDSASQASQSATNASLSEESAKKNADIVLNYVNTAQNVTIGTTQTITGDKTFTGNNVFSGKMTLSSKIDSCPPDSPMHAGWGKYLGFATSASIQGAYSDSSIIKADLCIASETVNISSLQNLRISEFNSQDALLGGTLRTITFSKDSSFYLTYGFCSGWASLISPADNNGCFWWRSKKKWESYLMTIVKPSTKSLSAFCIYYFADTGEPFAVIYGASSILVGMTSQSSIYNYQAISLKGSTLMAIDKIYKNDLTYCKPDVNGGGVIEPISACGSISSGTLPTTGLFGKSYCNSINTLFGSTGEFKMKTQDWLEEQYPLEIKNENDENIEDVSSTSETIRIYATKNKKVNLYVFMLNNKNNPEIIAEYKEISLTTSSPYKEVSIPANTTNKEKKIMIIERPILYQKKSIGDGVPSMCVYNTDSQSFCSFKILTQPIQEITTED